MDANAMFPSKYLKSSDIGDRKPVVTISGIEIETLGNEEEGKEKKPVIYFQGKEKGLVCNKTNWNTMISLYGSETQGWIGKAIRLQTMEVSFKGVMSMAIRISITKPASTAVVEVKPENEMSETEIPF